MMLKGKANSCRLSPMTDRVSYYAYNNKDTFSVSFFAFNFSFIYRYYYYFSGKIEYFTEKPKRYLLPAGV